MALNDILRQQRLLRFDQVLTWTKFNQTTIYNILQQQQSFICYLQRLLL